MALSWRDIILIGGGLFLIAKATHEIHAEVEAHEQDDDAAPKVFIDTRRANEMPAILLGKRK